MIRLRQFSYFVPTSIKEAVEISTEKGPDALLLAGGTDLLVRMKRGHIRPPALINLKQIDALNGIQDENGEALHIGALTSIAAIEDSALVKANQPVLAQAAGLLGARSIRNLATIGGNIGRASPASDMAPALVVLKARVCIEGSSGGREMDIEDVFKGPGVTNLADGEIITAFTLAKMTSGTGAAYLKLGRRAGGGDCALVGVAALISMEESHPSVVRIALSSVGPKPLRARQAEQVLVSGPLTKDSINQAAQAASEEATPITDMRCSASYRKEMVRILTYRALREAQQKAQGGIAK